jgi:hypothetical protein
VPRLHPGTPLVTASAALLCRNQHSSRQAANVRVQAGRRDSLAAGLVLLPALANLQPAVAAERSTYEPMEALKGKDYGKPRMT